MLTSLPRASAQSGANSAPSITITQNRQFQRGMPAKTLLFDRRRSRTRSADSIFYTDNGTRTFYSRDESRVRLSCIAYIETISTRRSANYVYIPLTTTRRINRSTEIAKINLIKIARRTSCHSFFIQLLFCLFHTQSHRNSRHYECEACFHLNLKELWYPR